MSKGSSARTYGSKFNKEFDRIFGKKTPTSNKTVILANDMCCEIFNLTLNQVTDKQREELIEFAEYTREGIREHWETLNDDYNEFLSK